MRLRIPFAYKVPAPARRRGGNRWDMFRRSSVMAEFREVDHRDLDFAIHCRGIGGGLLKPYAVDYSVYRGGLVRPIINAENQPADVHAFVAGTSVRGLDRDTGLMRWSENPFMASRNTRDWFGAPLAQEESEDDLRLYGGQREARLAEMAPYLEGCIVVDGILLRPAMEPVWGVKAINGGLHADLAIDADLTSPGIAFRIGSPAFDEFCSNYRMATGFMVGCFNQPVEPIVRRPDMLRIPERDLLVSGAFAMVVRELAEFEGRLDDGGKAAFAAIREAAADIEANTWSGDDIEKHLAAFAGIPAVFANPDLDGLNRAAQTRFRHARSVLHLAEAASLAMDLPDSPGHRP